MNGNERAVQCRIANPAQRGINNSDPTNNPLITEDYIGKFHKDTIANSTQVDTLDALLDRILLTFYIGWSNGASYDYVTEFFTTNQAWQETRLVGLGQNQKQTVIWPLFEASWILPGRPFLGNWLTDSLSQGNSYLKAESIWKNLHQDSLDFGVNGVDHYGDVSLDQHDSIQGYMWFAYRSNPFPQWVFDECLDPDPKERLRNPESLQFVSINDNSIEVSIPEGLVAYEYVMRLYSVDGKLLFDEVRALTPGRNSLVIPIVAQGVAILNLLNSKGQDSKSIFITIRSR